MSHSDGKGDTRRHPKQSRSQETWNAILAAAADLFGTQGYEQTTTHQVAERAGVSVGALYRYFSSKKALVIELYRRYFSDLRSRLLEEFPYPDPIGEDLRPVIRKTVAMAFRLYSEHPGLRRVLVDQSRKIPELVALRREQELEIRGAVGNLLSAFPGVQLPDTEAGAHMIRLLIESLIDDCVLYQPEGVEDFGRERLLDAATDFILRYATGRVD